MTEAKTFTAKLVKIDEIPHEAKGTNMRIPASVFITTSRGEKETFIVFDDNYKAGAFA